MVVELTVSNDITLLLSWYTNDSQISGLNVGLPWYFFIIRAGGVVFPILIFE